MSIVDILTTRAGTAAIYRINPVAELAATVSVGVGVGAGIGFGIGIALVLSIDCVSASVAFACGAVLFFFAGPGQFLRRTLPMAIVAVFAATPILLYGRASGTSHWRFLLVNVTGGSIGLSIATLLRVLAIGLPTVVLFVTVDLTDFTDGLH